MRYEEEELKVNEAHPGTLAASPCEKRESNQLACSSGIGSVRAGVWRYDCRCGDEFVLREAQLIDGIDVPQRKSV